MQLAEDYHVSIGTKLLNRLRSVERPAILASAEFERSSCRRLMSTAARLVAKKRREKSLLI
jgi:hypothetical protein